MSRSKDLSALPLKTIRPAEMSFLNKILDGIPTNVWVPMFSDWAEQNRYIPPGVSPYHGPFRKDTAPHMNEILDKLHPDDPAKEVILMKSVQSTGTVTVAENALGAYIRHKLGSVLFLTSSKGIGKVRSSSAIDVLIDNSGLGDLVKPMSTRMKRKTADTAMYKEFEGGIKLMISSYNSIADLKSNTFEFIICDEWDEAGADLKGQGDVAKTIHGRTMGVRNYKILKLSTPTNMESSRIYKDYIRGDQREFLAPCPFCGGHQQFQLKGGKTGYGLTFSMKKNEVTGHRILDPKSIRFQCKHCGKDIPESKKDYMLKNGYWEPTASAAPEIVSYHVSSMMSPTPLLGWPRICAEFIDSDFGKDLLNFKAFTINNLGMPWASVRNNMPWQELRDRAEDYTMGEVPDGGLVITGGCDVQKDRLELQVVAIGKGMEKWTIDYQIFYGDTANIDDPAWIALEDFCYSASYNIDGADVLISRVAIDCGYKPGADGMRGKDYAGKSSIVYDFVAPRPDKFVAVMGIDETKMTSLIKEERVQGSPLKKRYNIAASLFKDVLFANIKKPHGPGAIHVPRYRIDGGQKHGITDEWYRQFMSERYQEIKPGKFGYHKTYKRNEVLDTFIYAMAAAEYLNLSSWSAEIWDNYKSQIT